MMGLLQPHQRKRAIFFPRRRRGKNMGRSIILLFTAFLVGVLKG